jgi:hypothetical protein
MKKICFISSHLHAGSFLLCRTLNENEQCQVHSAKGIYQVTSGLELLNLTKTKHKCNQKNAVFIYENMFNHQISSDAVYQYCKFIYLIRRPEEAISEFIKNKVSLNYAVNYYMYRLRRICEICKKTPNAIFLTFDDLKNGMGFSEIEAYLKLKKPLEYDLKHYKNYAIQNNPELIDFKTRKNLEERYEKYLSWIKNQTQVQFCEK